MRAALTTENLWLGILGLVPGLLLGYGLAVYLFSIFQTDIVSFSPAVTRMKSKRMPGSAWDSIHSLERS